MEKLDLDCSLGPIRAQTLKLFFLNESKSYLLYSITHLINEI